MAGVCPLGAVAGFWQAALPKNETKAINVSEAMVSLDDVGRSWDFCELDQRKISEESNGPESLSDRQRVPPRR